jgi:hypothetical protein
MALDNVDRAGIRYYAAMDGDHPMEVICEAGELPGFMSRTWFHPATSALPMSPLTDRNEALEIANTLHRWDDGSDELGAAEGWLDRTYADKQIREVKLNQPRTSH